MPLSPRPRATIPHVPIATPACHLRVRVREAGQTRVDLTLPAAAVEFLTDLMPTDLVEKLLQRGLDVGNIAANTVSHGFTPGEMFEMVDGIKQVRVWLE